MTESTRRFLDDPSPRAWFFNTSKKKQKLASPPSAKEEDGFYDDRGRFIKHRPKTGGDNILPPIPARTHNIYQQMPNEDGTYINSKFLEHHLNARKKIEEKTGAIRDQKMKSRPLPKPPRTPSSSQPKYTFEGYEVPVISREDYKNLELPAEPENQTDYSGKARRQSSLSRQKYGHTENPYEVAIRSKRLLPSVPGYEDDQHENDTRARRQLPTTPRTTTTTANPYVFFDEDDRDDNYLSLQEESG